MNNPFDPVHIQEERAEREAHRLKLRSNLLIAIFCAILAGFVAVLYQAQIVEGADYRSNSTVRNIQPEQVDSVRGEILDRYGRVLVTNEVSYNVTLDYSAMGSGRNEILAQLLDICREEGVAWTDDLPISKAAPWIFTTETPFSFQQKNSEGEMETRLTYLGSLAKKCKWTADDKPVPTAGELLAAMCRTFGLIQEGEAPDARDRELAGVLYELHLRLREVDNSAYLFTQGVDMTFISKVKERALAGVRIETATTRKYETSYAAHVLGFTGKIDRGPEWDHYKELSYPMNATVGKEGVELAFEEALHGVSGSRLIEKDDAGNTISQEWRKEPKPGDNVVLTLDIDLQQAVEEILADGVTHQIGRAHV